MPPALLIPEGSPLHPPPSTGGSPLRPVGLQVVIEVLEILTETELRGRCMNNKKLGERKNCNLPGEGQGEELEICNLPLRV